MQAKTIEADLRPRALFGAGCHHPCQKVSRLSQWVEFCLPNDIHRVPELVAAQEPASSTKKL